MVCGCCTKALPRYIQHVISVFPADGDNETEVPQNMSNVVQYGNLRPDKLSVMASLMAKRMHRNLPSDSRIAVIALKAMAQLVDGCRSNLALFEPTILESSHVALSSGSVQVSQAGIETVGSSLAVLSSDPV